MRAKPKAVGASNAERGKKREGASSSSSAAVCECASSWNWRRGIGGGEEGLFIIKLSRSKSRKGKKEEGVKAEEEVKSEAAERREKE